MSELSQEEILKGKEILEKYEISGKRRTLKGFELYFVKLIAIAFSVFQFYTIGFKFFPPQIQRPLHVGFAFLLIFLLIPPTLKSKKDKIPIYDWIIAIIVIIVFLYPIVFYEQLIYRAGLPTTIDIIIGLIAVILILEGTRRVVGLPLMIIALLFVLYAIFGKSIPGIFAHRGFTITRVVDHLFYTLDGIFGIPVSVSTKFVYAFILFGALAERTGVSELIVNIARAIAGRAPGGPAKISVITSAALGTVSGSSVANVVTDGVFNIPLMKKTGYKDYFAGAVEAAASTGGQIMPPVMGAAAFIMAEFIGVPYVRIIFAAIVPAILYFMGVYFSLHFEAKRLGLRGLRKEEIPNLIYELTYKGYILTPFVVLVYKLMAGFTVMEAAFVSIISVILTSFLGEMAKTVTQDFDEKNKIFFLYISIYVPLLFFFIFFFLNTIKIIPLAFFTSLLSIIFCYLVFRFKSVVIYENKNKVFLNRILNVIKNTFFLTVEGFEEGAYTSLAVVAACASAGYIAGMSTLTGLALRFATAVVSLATSVKNFLNSIFSTFLPFLKITSPMPFTLIFTVIACLILGMGIPTTGNYIIMAIITAPALFPFLSKYDSTTRMLIAHMFVFYYGILADVTPPVALAAYAGAGIAGSNPFKTGFTAFKLALAGFLVPFVFVYNPILLGVNFVWSEAIIAYTTAIIGVIFLGASSIGYFVNKLNFLERTLLFISSVLLIVPGLKTDLIGIGLGVLVYIVQKLKIKKVEVKND
ncbi:MAG: TRAP transporter permease [Caldisericia bacterium]|nr:TRAP transporter permease [Caldisericia bacterium]